MEGIIHIIFIAFHMLALIAVLWSSLAQLKKKEKKVTKAMFHGALVMLVSGLALYLIDYTELNIYKILSKLSVLLIVLVIMFVKKDSKLENGSYYAILFLLVLNILLALSL